jgi:hypothetical protein
MFPSLLLAARATSRDGEMTMDRESSRAEFTLLDLVLAVQDEAGSDREVVATLAHLLDSDSDEPAVSH